MSMCILENPILLIAYQSAFTASSLTMAARDVLRHENSFVDESFTVPPVISLEDLIEAGNGTAQVRVLFPQCNPTEEELAACEQHLRRCLTCPVSSNAPTHAACGEVLQVLLCEMESSAASGGSELSPLESALDPTVASRAALDDLEEQLVLCRTMVRGIRVGTRWMASERARWQRREEAFEALARPLRKDLAIPGQVRALDNGLPAGASTAVGSPQGDGALSKVRRALSFDQKARRALSFDRNVRGGGGAAAEAAADATAEQRSQPVGRSLSFDRLRRKLGGRGVEPPTASPASAEALPVGSTKKSRNKLAVKRAAAAANARVGSVRCGLARGGLPEPNRLAKPTTDQPGQSAAGTTNAMLADAAGVCTTRSALSSPAAASAAEASAGDASGDASGGALAVASPLPPFVCDLKNGGRLHEIIIFGRLKFQILKHLCLPSPLVLSPRPALSRSAPSPRVCFGISPPLPAPCTQPPCTQLLVSCQPMPPSLPSSHQLPCVRYIRRPVLPALVSAWQRRSFKAAGEGAAVAPLDRPPPFPVEEDGSLMLRGGVSGWLLDEFGARCGRPRPDENLASNHSPAHSLRAAL